MKKFKSAACLPHADPSSPVMAYLVHGQPNLSESLLSGWHVHRPGTIVEEDGSFRIRVFEACSFRYVVFAQSAKVVAWLRHTSTRYVLPGDYVGGQLGAK